MNEFTTMTDLGKLFDESSHKLGKWLMAIGLRTPDNTPSQKAYDGGFVKQAPTGRGTGYFYLWHRDRTIQALESAGHFRVDQESAKGLIGPFEAVRSSTNGYVVNGDDGASGVWVYGEDNAATLVSLMNVAHDNGWFGGKYKKPAVE